MTKMTKRQKDQYEKLLENIAKVTHTDLDEIKELAEVDALYSSEAYMYEGQSVLNFYKVRIKPLVEKGELNKDFDARYREWHIRVCESCNEEFAYAYSYEGIKFCSLECLDVALRKVGMKVTPGRSLKQRWGALHPALISAPAFAVLKNLHGSDVPDSFVDQVTTHPKSPIQYPLQ